MAGFSTWAPLPSSSVRRQRRESHGGGHGQRCGHAYERTPCSSLVARAGYRHGQGPGAVASSLSAVYIVEPVYTKPAETALDGLISVNRQADHGLALEFLKEYHNA
jgi:hypothetical protein